jgi:cytochrome c oxidase assembly protein subunit 15
MDISSSGQVHWLVFRDAGNLFVVRKKVSKSMAWRLGGIAGLVGFIGWWMVESDLKDDLFAPGSHPRVSQYRLTAHLAAAFACYVAT